MCNWKLINIPLAPFCQDFWNWHTTCRLIILGAVCACPSVLIIKNTRRGSSTHQSFKMVSVLELLKTKDNSFLALMVCTILTLYFSQLTGCPSLEPVFSNLPTVFISKSTRRGSSAQESFKKVSVLWLLISKWISFQAFGVCTILMLYIFPNL